MRQFLCGGEAAFQDLEARAHNACVVFQHQEMPPGTVPPRLRIGFETQSDGSVQLPVDAGATYRGDSAEVRQWLTTGARQFANFTELRAWLEHTLKPCYAIGSTEQPARIRPVEDLTDFSAVRQSIGANSENRA